MVESWDKAKELVGMVEEDPNYYLEVQEKGMDSIQSKMDTLKSTMQDFWYNFLDQGAVNNVITGLTTVAEVLTSITKNAQKMPAIGDTLSTALLGLTTVGTSGLIDNIIKARQDMKMSGKSTGLFGGIGSGFKNTLKQLSQLGMSEQALKDGEAFELFGYSNNLFGAFKQGFKTTQAQGASTFKSLKAGVTDVWSTLTGFSKAVVGIGAAFLAWEVVSKTFDALTTSAKESKDRVSSLNQEFENQRQTMQDNRETIDSIGSEWQELAKGVDIDSNENISLTNDEYQRYLELNKQISQMFPSTISGFDAQGNAILSLKGSLSELNSVYEQTLQQQSMDRYNEGINDYLREFENRTGNMSFGDQLATAWSGGSWSDQLGNESVIETIEKLKKADNFETDVAPYFKERGGAAGLAKEINDLLGTSEETTKEEWQEILGSGALESAIQSQQEIIDEAKSDLVSVLQDYVNSVTAEGGDYGDLENNVVSALNQMIASSSTEELKALEGNRSKASAFVRDYLDILSGNEKAQASLVNVTGLNQDSSLQEILDVYKNDIPVLTEAFGKSKEDLVKQFKLDDVEDMQKLYDDILKSSDKFTKSQKKGNKEIKTGKELMEDFIDEQDINTLDELNTLKDIMADVNDMDDLERKFTVDTFSIDALDEKISSLKENISQVEDAVELMNDAMSESNSARGLTVETAEAIANQFSDLEGFDYDRLFESTSSGNHLNGEYFEQLQKQFADLEIEKYSSQVEKWQKQYQDLCVEIANAGTAEEKRQRIAERDILSEKINKAKEYQSQIEGITNAVNLWQQAEARGDEGDLYDSVRTGLEDAKQMFQEGLIGDDGFQAFTQMFSNQDLSALGSDQVAEIFQAKLPQMESWLADGFQGVSNFLQDAGRLNEGLIDAAGNVNFDFMPDIETLSQQLGVSESLIDTMFKKLNQYGFDIDFSEAADNLRSLRQEVVESGEALDEATREKYSVNVDAEGKDAIVEQIEAAKTLKKEMEDARQDSGDAWEYVNDQMEYLEARLGEIESPDIDIDTPKGLEQIENAIDTINERAKVEISIDWTSQDPSYYEGQIAELEGAIKNLDANGDSVIDIETEGGQEALDVLIELEQKAFETSNTNIEMAVDTTQLDGNVAEMVGQFSQIQSAATTLSSILHAQELGINVSDDDVNAARDTVASFVSEFSNAHAATADALGINIDTTDTSEIDSVAQKVTELTANEYAVKLGVEDSALKNLGSDDKNVNVNVIGDEQLNQVKQDIADIPKNTDVSLNVDVAGEDKVSTVKEAVNNVPKNTGINLSVNTTGETAVESVQNSISSLPSNKAVNVTANAYGSENVTNLNTAVSNLPSVKNTTVSASVQGQPQVNQLDTSIMGLQSRTVTETAVTLGAQAVSTLKATIDGLSSKTVTITTNYVQNGKPSSANGNAHAQGNANGLMFRGRAFAHGVWGATKDSVSLVGELGR